MTIIIYISITSYIHIYDYRYMIFCSRSIGCIYHFTYNFMVFINDCLIRAYSVCHRDVHKKIRVRSKKIY